jgi:ArsR family transcriptional regulator
MVAFEHDLCHTSGMDIETAARGLAELGNITRLQIVRLLVRAGGEGLAIGELQSRLGVPASTLAFHLRGLVSARLVTQQREGRVVRCTPALAAIDATLAFVKEHCCAGFGDAQRPAATATSRRRQARAA